MAILDGGHRIQIIYEDKNIIKQINMRYSGYKIAKIMSTITCTHISPYRLPNSNQIAFGYLNLMPYCFATFTAKTSRNLTSLSVAIIIERID